MGTLAPEAELLPHTPDLTTLLALLPAAPGRFLLDSAGGPADLARFSFLGHRPFLVLSASGRRCRIETASGVTERTADPLAVLDELLAEYRIPVASDHPGLPPFRSGVVGYFSFEMGQGRAPTRLPDVWLGFYDAVLAVDHLTGSTWLCRSPVANGTEAADELRRLAAMAASVPPRSTTVWTSGSAPASNFSRTGYCNAIATAQQWMRSGRIEQINLSQRFTAPLPCPPLELWRRLRGLNPAPFAAFLDAGDHQVISASPERFVRVSPDTPRVIETRPVKGTRPRGQNPAADNAMRDELLASAKERAELALVTAAAQTELERVCLPGTVAVTEPRRLEAYATVFQTAATVSGHLRPDVSTGSLLRELLPAISVAGVPKDAGLAAIAELEPEPRHVYTGSLGYIGFDGAIDLNTVIRSFVVADDTVQFHAGGGITAASDPVAEYEETLVKAAALLAALAMDGDTAAEAAQ